MHSKLKGNSHITRTDEEDAGRSMLAMGPPGGARESLKRRYMNALKGYMIVLEVVWAY